MLFVRELTPEEEKELSDRMKSENKTKIFVRLKTVELSNQRKTVQEISKLMNRHVNTTRTYIHKFNSGGFKGLMPRKGTGAPQKLRELGIDYFEDLLSRPPSNFEKLNSQSQNWNYELITEYLLQYEQIKVYFTTVWYHLRRIKYTSGRSKLSVTSPDPEYQIKRDKAESLEKKASLGH